MGKLHEQYLNLSDRDLLAQCDVDTYRASGPGGQKRNKTSSAVRLRHRPTHLAVIAAESRSQHENRARALRRLRQALALKLREPLDGERYVPGEVMAQCLSASARLCVGRRDHRYDLVVAELLDLFQACECRVSTTAAKLGVSTAQWVSFVSADPKLWARINDMRTAAGLATLRMASK